MGNALARDAAAAPAAAAAKAVGDLVLAGDAVRGTLANGAIVEARVERIVPPVLPVLPVPPVDEPATEPVTESGATSTSP
jgi:hypothetical protein